MKSLKIILAAAVLASPVALFADPPAPAPTMSMQPTHMVKTRTVTTRRVTHTDAVPAAVHVTVNTHENNGMHKGWMKHCTRHMKNGHRVRTCVKTHM